MRILLGLVAFLFMSTFQPVAAEQPLEGYVAKLSAQDHFNSKGVRLKSAAAIIRQDRANFHRFKVRDPEDEPDSFFASKDNRALMEEFLRNGRASQETLNAIVNGSPLVHVEIYSKHIVVTVQ